ncbi:MAG TPA: AAA family ATPase [Opitutales bacterium]|jgi:DNA repair protein RecN (Recombination protein N)|nr:AAA family ATPase [Opitutales bacterium]
MLQFLRIHNLALVERAELEFGAGFTAVTGETGAGKSVLLGALSLLAGNRADKSVIRQGTEACEAEGVLSFSGAALARVNALLEKLGLPACEDDTLVLRRSLSATKAPRMQINGAMATLGALQELGENWVDFHGPGEPQKLFQEKHQREMLDAFGQLEDAVGKFSANYGIWCEGLREAEALASAGRMSADEIEFTRLQIARLDQLDPTPENIATLERDFNRASKAQELVALAGELENGLAGEEGLSAKFPPLVRAARELAELDPTAAPLAQRLEAAVVELQEVGGDFGRLAAGFDFDAETTQTLQERMSLWLELQRRYGGDATALRVKRDELARKVAAQSDIEGTLAKLAAESATREKALRSEAAKLREARTASAKTLEKKAARLLKALGFKQAGLQISVTAAPELREHGDSHIEILFAPNPGQAPLPLSKIASSGETARVMLALKAVLAEADATPLLVFDEVDANVGGEIGAAVGNELAALGGKHQVFCVTHLPQVAAKAARHFVVEKHHATKATSISIREISSDTNARIDELARMLGDRSAKSAQQHAKALLEQ